VSHPSLYNVAVHGDAACLYTSAEIHAWLESEQQAQAISVTRIPFSALDQWSFGGAPLRLGHRSGRFFTIEGLHVETDAGPVHTWDQPIIHQPEIGILGILTSRLAGERRYLMQAKVEPGNINGVQLSPTVQATFSNYSRVHNGASTPFLEFFLEADQPGRQGAQILIDQLQGEQGSRFLRKRNRNMVVEIPGELAQQLPVGDRFRWLTLRQIRQLLREENRVNMDARSVLACIPTSCGEHGAAGSSLQRFSAFTFFDDGAGARNGSSAPARQRAPLSPSRHSTDEIIAWLTALRSRHTLRLEPRPLDRLDKWVADDWAIAHESGTIFSVIAVETESRTREVRRWTQPLLCHPGQGLNGMLLQRINGVMHALMRACIYPGNREIFELGSTVSRSNAEIHFGRPDAPRFLELFRWPPPAELHYNVVQSEEGGRFYHYQNRYIIRELPSNVELEPSPMHRWMSLAQIQDFVRHGYVNIEGRNLLACLDLSA